VNSRHQLKHQLLQPAAHAGTATRGNLPSNPDRP
jgi:hypothetical protein